MKPETNMMTAKIPPHNMESEQIVLGAGLLGKTISPYLLKEDFYRQSHKEIFDAIRTLSDDGMEIDMTVVCNYLSENNKLEVVGGAAYIAQLTSVPPVKFDVDVHADIIRKKAVLRKVIEGTSEVTFLSYDEQFDVEMILAKWQRYLAEVTARLASKKSTKLDMDFDELMSRFSAADTHLECINDVTGGLHDGDLIVVAGRPSMGKTSLVLGFLKKISLEDDLQSIYFGPQVTQEKIFARLFSAVCQISITKLRRSKDLTSAERDSMQKIHKKIIKSNRIDLRAAPESFSAMYVAGEVRALAKKLAKKGEKLGVVVIENLQQLTWPEKLNSRKHEVDAIYRCLKSLAMELHVPIVLSAQINRGVEGKDDKRPLPSDIKDSGDVEELADAIFILYWDEYYHQGESANEDGWAPAEIDVYKGGPPVVLRPQFNAKCPSWRDAPQ